MENSRTLRVGNNLRLALVGCLFVQKALAVAAHGVAHGAIGASVTPRSNAFRRGWHCAGLVLLEDRDDLFSCVALALHLGTSLGSKYKEIPHPAWLGLRGYGQTPSWKAQ